MVASVTLFTKFIAQVLLNCWTTLFFPFALICVFARWSHSTLFCKHVDLMTTVTYWSLIVRCHVLWRKKEAVYTIDFPTTLSYPILIICLTIQLQLKFVPKTAAYYIAKEYLRSNHLIPAFTYYLRCIFVMKIGRGIIWLHSDY